MVVVSILRSDGVLGVLQRLLRGIGGMGEYLLTRYGFRSVVYLLTDLRFDWPLHNLRRSSLLFEDLRGVRVIWLLLNVLERRLRSLLIRVELLGCILTLLLCGTASRMRRRRLLLIVSV